MNNDDGEEEQMTQEFTERQKLKAYALLLLSYLTLGAMALTANTAMSPLIAEMDLTDASGALLISCLSMGYFVSSLVCGFVAESIGTQRTMRVAAGLLLSGYFAFSLLDSLALMYGALFIAGLSWGSINNIVNSTVSVMYPGSTSRLNLGHACYSISAVLFPLLMGFVLQLGGSWRIPAHVVVALSLLLFVLTFVIPLPEVFRNNKKTSASGKFGFLRSIRFWMGALMFFCYVGTESAACAWLSEWLSRQNEFFAKVPAETMVSLMWLMMTVGRLGFAALGQKLDRKMLLLLQACGFLLGMLGVVFLSTNTHLSVISIAFMGLSMSATYATIVANNTRYVTDGAASGFMYGGGGIGSAVVPYLAGLVSDAAGLKAGMIALCVVLVFFVFISFMNRIMPEEK